MKNANCKQCKHRIMEYETWPCKSRIFCRRERIATVDIDTESVPARFLCSDYEEKDDVQKQ